MQQLPDIEESDSKGEISGLKWTLYNGGRKVCVNFKTDTDTLNKVVYCYASIFYLKEKKVNLKVLDY